MPIRKAKEFLISDPVELSEHMELKITKRKWWAVILLVIGGVMLAGRLPVPMWLPYIFFFFGHGGLLHSFYDKRDVSMTIVNAFWILIDIIGMIRWWS